MTTQTTTLTPRAVWECGQCAATAHSDYQGALIGASYHAKVTGHEMPWITRYTLTT